MYAAESRGELPKGTADEWAKETDFDNLPEKVSMIGGVLGLTVPHTHKLAIRDRKTSTDKVEPAADAVAPAADAAPEQSKPKGKTTKTTKTTKKTKKTAPAKTPAWRRPLLTHGGAAVAGLAGGAMLAKGLSSDDRNA